ncbi:hypothetical protein V9T40_008301 [Parthenolecanium corni]|uniref:Uncharacterized protein n=1 Tax=Parthenolecanium corni TaxID=536013 RepID=A0AAN9Y7Y4_9HEMI
MVSISSDPDEPQNTNANNAKQPSQKFFVHIGQTCANRNDRAQAPAGSAIPQLKTLASDAPPPPTTTTTTTTTAAAATRLGSEHRSSAA